jgi:hypothetical protein
MEKHPMPTNFDLTITFAGLCLAATDAGVTSKNNNLLHVLMMRYDEQNTQGMQHFAKLLYDADYLSGRDSGTQTLACADLYNGVLDLDLGTPTIDFSSPPPAVIASLSKLANVDTLDPTYVTTNSNHVANARITLHKGAFAPAQGEAATFDTSSGPQDLSHFMVWTMNGAATNGVNAQNQDCLTLTFQPLETNAGDPPAPAPLQLVPKDGKVNLYFINAMPQDMPSDVPPDTTSQWSKGQPVMHFDGFFSAFPGTPLAIIEHSMPTLANNTGKPGDNPLEGWSRGCSFLAPAAGAKLAELFDAPVVAKPEARPTIVTPVCIHAIVSVGVTNPSPPSVSLAGSGGHSSHSGPGM